MTDATHVPGVLRSLAGVVAAPARTFENLKARPRALRALLVVGAAMLVLSFLLLKNPFTGAPGPMLLDIFASFDASEMPMEQRATVEKVMSGPVGYASAAIVPIAVVVSALLVALVFTGENYLLSNTNEFRRVLAVVAHTSVVDLVEFLFKAPLYFAKGSLKVYSSLAILLPEDAADTRLFRLLDAFDAFAIWKLVLLTIGLAIVTSRPRAQAALLVCGPWLAWVAATVALHDVFAGISDHG
ncbi:MAG: YIP1 family protein [bacterium]